MPSDKQPSSTRNLVLAVSAFVMCAVAFSVLMGYVDWMFKHEIESSAELSIRVFLILMNVAWIAGSVKCGVYFFGRWDDAN